MLSVLIGLLLVLAVVALIYLSPAFSKFVGVFNQAGIFVLIVLLGLSMLGSHVLSIFH